MRFRYSTTSPTQNEFDSLPRLPLLLQRGEHRIEATGLVDSGALEFNICFYRSQSEFEIKPNL